MRVPAEGGSCWVDGEPMPVDRAAISATDPGLLAGLGLFETVAVRRGKLLEWSAHLERLRGGLERLGMDLPPDAHLVKPALEAASDVGSEHGWLKVVVTGAGRTVVFADTLDPAQIGRPLTAVILPWRRSLRDPLAGMKSLNYAGNLLGLDMARRRGADEGLWLNARGHLAEGCTTNLFVVAGRRVFTPGEGEGILPGVTRAVVLRAAAGLDIQVHQGRVRLRRLERATEAFLTSSLRGLSPLVAVRGRPVGDGRPGPLTRRLAVALESSRETAAGAAQGRPGVSGQAT